MRGPSNYKECMIDSIPDALKRTQLKQLNGHGGNGKAESVPSVKRDSKWRRSNPTSAARKSATAAITMYPLPPTVCAQHQTATALSSQ